MFKKNDLKGGFKEVETVIGPSVKVKGNFNGQGNIVIEGILEGSLKTAGSVFVGEKAKISASVVAKEAKISGEVAGNVKIKGQLEIASSAKIFGDVECATLSIEKGASLNGKITMPISGEPKKEEVKK